MERRRLQCTVPLPKKLQGAQNPGCGLVSGGVGSGIVGGCPGSDGCGWSTRLGGGSRAGLGCGTFGCCSLGAVVLSSMVSLYWSAWLLWSAEDAA